MAISYLLFLSPPADFFSSAVHSEWRACFPKCRVWKLCMLREKKNCLHTYRRRCEEIKYRKTWNAMFIVSLVDGRHYHILEINLIKHHIKRHKENTFTRHFEKLVQLISSHHCFYFSFKPHLLFLKSKLCKLIALVQLSRMRAVVKSTTQLEKKSLGRSCCDSWHAFWKVEG